MTAPEYSVVIPCYRSADTISALCERVLAVFAELGRSVELILVDDGSPDDVADRILKLREGDSRIQLVRHLRNYGQHRALLTGMRYASGQWVVTIDDDFQNPPEEIPKLIDSVGDADAVIGYPVLKKHSSLRNLASWLVARTLAHVFRTGPDFRTGSFRLIRADVAQRLTRLNASYPLISAMLLITCRNLRYVPVRHDERSSGRSTYSVARMFALASVILFNYSKIPLQLMISLGALIAILAMLALAGIATAKLFFIDFNAGWASLISTIMFFGGLNLIALAVIGEYISRLLDQSSGSLEAIVQADYVNKS